MWRQSGPHAPRVALRTLDSKQLLHPSFFESSCLGFSTPCEGDWVQLEVRVRVGIYRLGGLASHGGRAHFDLAHQRTWVCRHPQLRDVFLHEEIIRAESLAIT